MEEKTFFPFNKTGEMWKLDVNTLIRPNSTWLMHHVPYRIDNRYDYGHYSYKSHGLVLPDDIEDLIFNDIVIVKSGEIVEVERNTNFGPAYDKFPQGRPPVSQQPHDVHAHFHLLSCNCRYTLRVQAAVQSCRFVVRSIERTFNVKYSGRAMIDGTTRAIMREEEMLKSWTRDFTKIYGGDI